MTLTATSSPNHRTCNNATTTKKREKNILFFFLSIFHNKPVFLSVAKCTTENAPLNNNKHTTHNTIVNEWQSISSQTSATVLIQHWETNKNLEFFFAPLSSLSLLSSRSCLFSKNVIKTIMIWIYLRIEWKKWK